MVLVPNKLTPLTRAQALNALAKAFLAVTGANPSPEVLSLLVAQTALETGEWKSLHNFNWGNIKAAHDYPLQTTFGCWEMVDGKRVDYPANDPHCMFRAYPDAASGVVDYIKTLKSRANWWNGLQTGTPEGFNAGLSTVPKYYTADPTAYLKLLKTEFEESLPLAKSYSFPEPSAPAKQTPSSGFLSSEWGPESSSAPLTESQVLEHADNYLVSDKEKVT